MSTVDAEAAVTPAGFDTLQRAMLDRRVSIYPARAFYPSTIGHPCDRLIVWKFIRWDEQAKHDAVLQSIFDQGRQQQPFIYQRLEELGFEIIRESDRPTQYKVKGGVISGRPDGKVIGFRGYRYKPPLVLEAKWMSDYQWQRIATAEDLRHAPSVWTRGYYTQGQTYAFLENLPRGLFALANKTTGMVKLVPFELDFGYAEDLLRRLERLAPMIQQGVDPEPIPYDANICGGCGFRALCYPPRTFGEGASVLEDAALMEALEERERLQEDKARYEQLDKLVKARFKDEGVKFALVGPFVVEGKPVEKKAYTVPARTEIHYEIRRTAPATPAASPSSSHLGGAPPLQRTSA